VEAVARDPYGIGYCTSRDWTPAVRAVALSESDGGPYVEPTREHVADRSYPLSRLIYWIFLHPAGKPVDPKIREFLRYVLSKEGQTDVLDERCYLPSRRRWRRPSRGSSIEVCRQMDMPPG